jgi:hypothetical protein
MQFTTAAAAISTAVPKRLRYFLHRDAIASATLEGRREWPLTGTFRGDPERRLLPRSSRSQAMAGHER